MVTIVMFMISGILVSVILQTVILHSVIQLLVILLSTFHLCVILLNAVLPNVAAPFQHIGLGLVVGVSSEMREDVASFV